MTSEVLPTIRRTGSYRIQEPVTASSAGGIASAVKRADDIMKAQKASGHDRAVVADSIFHQFGLFLPDVFIQSKPLEQVLMERWLDKMTQVKRLD